MMEKLGQTEESSVTPEELYSTLKAVCPNLRKEDISHCIRDIELSAGKSNTKFDLLQIMQHILN